MNRKYTKRDKQSLKIWPNCNRRKMQMKATLGTDVTSHLGSSYHSEKTVLARPPSWEFLRKQLPPPQTTETRPATQQD